MGLVPRGRSRPAALRASPATAAQWPAASRARPRPADAGPKEGRDTSPALAGRRSNGAKDSPGAGSPFLYLLTLRRTADQSGLQGRDRGARPAPPELTAGHPGPAAPARASGDARRDCRLPSPAFSCTRVDGKRHGKADDHGRRRRVERRRAASVRRVPARRQGACGARGRPGPGRRPGGHARGHRLGRRGAPWRLSGQARTRPSRRRLDHRGRHAQRPRRGPLPARRPTTAAAMRA